jgi:single-strand DNA-binding protein
MIGPITPGTKQTVTASSVPIGRFSLATNERFKDKSGKFQDRTEWHNVVVWRRLAEIVGEFVSKGSQLYVEGKLQTTSWQDRQSGEKKSRTEVVADDLVLPGSRDKRNEGQPPGSDQALNAKSTHLPRAMVTGTAGWFFLYSIFALSTRRNDIFNTLTSIFYFVFLFASNMFYPLEPLPKGLRTGARKPDYLAN